MTAAEIDEMASAYIECALFTADEEIIPPTSGEFNATPHLNRVTKAMKAEALKTCTEFFQQNADDLAGYPASSAGHDLWYTRNGHGVGFWEADHCTKEEGERLTESAKKIGGRNLYSNGRWFGFDIA